MPNGPSAAMTDGSGQRLMTLPPVSQGDDARVSCAYGADRLAALYCGFRTPPALPFGIWHHGWVPRYRSVHPDVLAFNCTGARRDQTYWVARRDQADYMRERGYPNARAIGLPVVYVPPAAPRPEPGTLLVVPPHAIANVLPDWDCRAYVEAIDALRGEFREIVVCVHPHSWDTGVWRNDFARAGYKVLRGLHDPSRPTPLHSLQATFSRFEYVTTNAFGSHLAYAAYFGARVSLYGPIAGFKRDDFGKALLFRRNPELRENCVSIHSEESLRRHHPDFFTHPREAPLRVEWAREELGEPCKVSPAEMRRLFRWALPDRVRRGLGRIGRRVRANLPLRAQASLRRIGEDAAARARNREFQRLCGLPAATPGETTLLGAPFSFLDAPSFLESWGEIVDRQRYAFFTGAKAPLIVDCGAGIGLGVYYFKSLHPRGRIVALEPDPASFAVLEKNCRALGLRDVELHPAAVGAEAGTRPFRERTADAAGRLARPGEEADAVPVPVIPLRRLLAEPVQLLRLQARGAEVEILESCGDLLANVEHLSVEYHSFSTHPQGLDRLMAILARAGFRLHAEVPRPSSHPLAFLDIRTGRDAIDMSLRVSAFR